MFRAIPNTFLKNDLDLANFDKKARNFFSSKVFSRPLRHIESKKNQKKNSFPKVDGSPWIDPFIKQTLIEQNEKNMRQKERDEMSCDKVYRHRKLHYFVENCT